MKNILIIAVLLLLALYGYQKFQPKNTITNFMTDIATNAPAGFAVTPLDIDEIPPTYVDSDPSSAADSTLSITPAPPIATMPSFTCDGRQHCSQMTSCAEATYFIKNCPNTKMDGNNDGIPCEQQWCR
jgi:Tfp pilus assembly protein PilE